MISASNRAIILPDCYVTKRRSPKIQVTQLAHPGSTEAIEVSAKLQTIWMMPRIMTKSKQQIPGWAKLISVTGSNRLITIDYYPAINQPITDYKTVQECLSVAEEATREVG